MARLRQLFFMIILCGVVPLLNCETTMKEPNPPKQVEVVSVGQRNISLNITDTDMPNGDIKGYIFKLQYKVYSDDVRYMEKMVTIAKTENNIYILHNLMPGVRYYIDVFTVNDAFNSYHGTTRGIQTLPDVPSSVQSPMSTHQTTSGGSIRWRRPQMPNGDMLGYRAVLEKGPNITQCRIYFLCINFCNSTIFGPPNGTCIIQHDTSLQKNQREMSLGIRDLRLGTAYTVNVIGYTEVGPGRHPVGINLRTLSIKPDGVVSGSIKITFSDVYKGFKASWAAPPFPGEDLEYFVELRDALKNEEIQSRFKKEPFYIPDFTTQGKLISYYNYTLSVRPKTSAGLAPSGTKFAFTTPHRGSLGHPQNLIIKILRCDQIQIHWDEADLSNRNGPITGYKFKDVNTGHTWDYIIREPQFWSLSNRPFTFSINVAENALYEIQMYAVSSISGQTGTRYSSQVFGTGKCCKYFRPSLVLLYTH